MTDPAVFNFGLLCLISDLVENSWGDLKEDFKEQKCGKFLVQCGCCSLLSMRVCPTCHAPEHARCPRAQPCCFLRSCVICTCCCFRHRFNSTLPLASSYGFDFPGFCCLLAQLPLLGSSISSTSIVCTAASSPVMPPLFLMLLLLLSLF